MEGIWNDKKIKMSEELYTQSYRVLYIMMLISKVTIWSHIKCVRNLPKGKSREIW